MHPIQTQGRGTQLGVAYHKQIGGHTAAPVIKRFALVESTHGPILDFDFCHAVASQLLRVKPPSTSPFEATFYTPGLSHIEPGLFTLRNRRLFGRNKNVPECCGRWQWRPAMGVGGRAWPAGLFPFLVFLLLHHAWALKSSGFVCLWRV